MTAAFESNKPKPMSFVDDGDEHAHASSDAVRACTDVLYPRCEEGPTFERWELVE